jgi:hypothetical protein
MKSSKRTFTAENAEPAETTQKTKLTIWNAATARPA